jgi:hypothetical protein
LRSILWRRLDRPGHEQAILEQLDETWRLSGTAVFEHESQPCALAYRILCDRDWSTLSTTVSGWVGSRRIDVGVDRTGNLEGCLDIDLNFSPSTNLLPIRRLNLAVGESAAVRAAWLRFPSFTLEPLEQTYTRLGERLYRYESAGGRFVAEVEVDEVGFAVRYGDIWSAVP